MFKAKYLSLLFEGMFPGFNFIIGWMLILK
jgi:hypothetical protein